jgi:hypothetical protein
MFCFLISGCVYESNLPVESYTEISYEENLKQSILHVDNSRMKLLNVELSDGINLDEANTILDNFYLSGKASGCGAPGNVVDSGKQWKAATFVGMDATRSHPIYIDKKTGAINRGTGVTNFLENGGELEIAQEIAGHSDVRTTKLYDGRKHEATKSEIERIRF